MYFLNKKLNIYLKVCFLLRANRNFRLHSFYKHSVFLGQSQYAYEKPHFSLISYLQYA